MAAAAVAEVAADPALRGALLEGLCLFVSGALLAQQPGQPAPAGSDAELAQVLPLLQGRLQERAEAAAAAAAALLQTRVAAPAGDDKDEDADMAPAAASSKEQQRGALVPMAQLTWGDEPAAGAAPGQLPTALPAELMAYPSCRQLQLPLLALQDAQLSSSQLQLFASGGLLQLLLGPGGRAPTQQLRQMVAAMAGSSGSSSVADAAVYQLLLWLLEAQQQEQPRQQQGAGEWQQLLQRSLVHEAWCRWQQGLWSGASAALPAAHASAVATAAQQQWSAAAAGPLRLHIAAGTVLASAVTAGPPTLIADRSARLLQLKLAARQLRAVAADSGSSSGSSSQAVAAAEWQAAAAVAAATIAAHLPSVLDAQQRQQLEAAVSWLAGQRCSGVALPASVAQQDAELLRLAEEALGSSSHSVLRELLQPLLLPALQGLLQGSAAAATASPQQGLLARGRMWALLGLLRLHLLLPPAGADPAAKYGLMQQHALSMLRCQVEPELAVRRRVAALPGAWQLCIAPLALVCPGLQGLPLCLALKSQPAKQLAHHCCIVVQAFLTRRRASLSWRPAALSWRSRRSGCSGAAPRAPPSRSTSRCATTWHALPPALALSPACWSSLASLGGLPASCSLAAGSTQAGHAGWNVY